MEEVSWQSDGFGFEQIRLVSLRCRYLKSKRKRKQTLLSNKNKTLTWKLKNVLRFSYSTLKWTRLSNDKVLFYSEWYLHKNYYNILEIDCAFRLEKGFLNGVLHAR